MRTWLKQPPRVGRFGLGVHVHVYVCVFLATLLRVFEVQESDSCACPY